MVKPELPYLPDVTGISVLHVQLAALQCMNMDFQPLLDLFILVFSHLFKTLASQIV